MGLQVFPSLESRQGRKRVTVCQAPWLCREGGGLCRRERAVLCCAVLCADKMREPPNQSPPKKIPGGDCLHLDCSGRV